MRNTIPTPDTTNGTHKGDIFQIAAQLKFNGVAVSVSNPTIKFQHYDDQNYMRIQCISSSPVNNDQVEWTMNDSGSGIYYAEVDPLHMPLGWYRVFFTGDYTQGTATRKIQLQGTVEIRSLTREDRILNAVLKLIADDDIEAYYDYAGQYLRFKPSSLLTFMNMGIDYLNSRPPMSTTYDIDSLPKPYDEFLIRYITAKAMFSKARLAIDNDLEVSDSHAIATKYFEKYKSLYNDEMQSITQDVSGYKKMNPETAGYMHKRNKYPAYLTTYYGVSYASRKFFAGEASEFH